MKGQRSEAFTHSHTQIRACCNIMHPTLQTLHNHTCIDIHTHNHLPMPRVLQTLFVMKCRQICLAFAHPLTTHRTSVYPSCHRSVGNWSSAPAVPGTAENRKEQVINYKAMRRSEQGRGGRASKREKYLLPRFQGLHCLLDGLVAHTIHRFGSALEGGGDSRMFSSLSERVVE
jgi:hypothetical protein